MAREMAYPVNNSIGIVGAGIGGLSLARSLSRHGFDDYSVFERSPKLSSRGGTIRLDALTQRALGELGVIEEVEHVGVRNEYFESLSNGRLLGRMHYDRSTDNHLISISREALQRILYESIESDRVHLNLPVNDILESTAHGNVELDLAGQHASFGLVVGADGIFSLVADRILSPQNIPEFTGLVVYYCIAKGEHLPELVHREHYISNGCTGFRQVTVPGGGSDGRWDSLQITTRGAPCSSEWSAEGTADEVKNYLELAGKNCLPGARSILENADRVFKWGMFHSVGRSTWVSPQKKAVLLGDAAHAMAPFTGQGACSAIQDAELLSRLIVERGINERVLREYELERKPICERSMREAFERGMHITAHGLTRRYIDLMTRGLAWSGESVHRRPLSRYLRRALNSGAPLIERVDNLLDQFR